MFSASIARANSRLEPDRGGGFSGIRSPGGECQPPGQTYELDGNTTTGHLQGSAGILPAETCLTSAIINDVTTSYLHDTVCGLPNHRQIR